MINAKASKRDLCIYWEFQTFDISDPVVARRSMSTIELGRLADLTQSRYSLSLSNHKRLVLFRLPRIARPDDPALRNDHNHGWTYYAMEAQCPHAGGPMTNAHIDIEDSSYIASCPWHAYDFNVETGESSFGVKACTFPVTLNNDRVVLHFAEAAGVYLSSLEPVSETVKFKHGPKELPEGAPRYLSDDATLSDWCVHILNTYNPEHKIELTTYLFSLFATREQSPLPMRLGAGTVAAPDEPPRGDLEEVEPSKMPRQGKGGSLKSRITMLHALANIEQWAIDLAIDICVRFATFQTTAPANELSQHLPRTFYYDWLKVANDEAKHFSLLRARLEELGTHFGALPVHHGLWESATRTKHDLRARISVIALVHEARGLDVNPMTIEKFRKVKDADSVEVLTIIHNDEITHVTTGHRWLTWICKQEGTDPVQVFRDNVQRYFKGAVKGPFNAEARQQAGMDRSFYENLQGQPWGGNAIAGG
ncbi:beta-1,4-xylosidase [Xylariaceae sp. FL0016]|nr:beta-1,4-xylosidase [Xylariaceae sp. FL0016]